MVSIFILLICVGGVRLMDSEGGAITWQPAKKIT